MVRIFRVGLAAVILAQLCAETDGRYAVTGVVLASLLINVVEVLGADGVVRLEAEIALGHHEVDDIVTAALDGVYVGGGFRADRKSEVILHQPVRPSRHHSRMPSNSAHIFSTRKGSSVQSAGLSLVVRI